MWKASETTRSKGRQSQNHYSFKITIALVFHCTKHFWELYLLCTSFTISLDISIFIALRCGNQGSERLSVIYGHITIKCQTKDYQPQVSQLQIVCSFLCITLTYPCWSLINNYQSTWNNLIFKTFPKAAMQKQWQKNLAKSRSSIIEERDWEAVSVKIRRDVKIK